MERTLYQLQLKVVLNGLHELCGLVFPIHVRFGRQAAFQGFLPEHVLLDQRQLSHVTLIVLHALVQTHCTGCSLFYCSLYTERFLLLSKWGRGCLPLGLGFEGHG